MRKAAIFCGSRDLPSSAPARARQILDHYTRERSDECIVIHGAARGADSIFAKAAESTHADVESYPAQWDTYGKSAGHRRNKQMLDRLLELQKAGYEPF